MLARLGLVVVSLGVGLAGLAGSATAQDVGCGAVLRTDTTLTADVTGCQGTGLVIGAPGITVDLGGHTVSGLSNQGGDPGQVGIDDSTGFDGVTIRNGSIESFGRGGVWLAGVDDARVEGLQIELSREFGVLVDGGARDTVTDNHLLFPGTSGIVVRGAAAASSRNAITGNRLESLTTAGITLEDGRIAGTTIDGNDVTGALADEHWGGGIIVGRDDAVVTGTRVRANAVHFNFDRGIFVGAGSSGTTITANTLTDNPFAAVENEGRATAVRANRFHDDLGLTGVGVWVKEGSAGVVVEGNSMKGVSDAGVDDGGTGTAVRLNAIDGRLGEVTFGFWAGIVVRPESAGARVEANAVTQQSQDGITVSGRDTRVSHNVVAASRFGDGVHVNEDAAGASLRGNVATRNNDDGLDVASPSTALARNVAADDGDLGIVAVAGVTDAGGNRAAGNGDPAQCVGVVCVPVVGP
jgi:hypothetical protein